MTVLVICAVSMLASGLTLFAGFGLGTLLMPAFALFFPAEVAVGLTAVVHFANNLFKLGLLGRFADRATALRFGVTAVAGSYAGAKALVWLSGLGPLLVYSLAGRNFEATPVKVVIGTLLLAFAAIESSPRLSEFRIAPRLMPLGGLLSGFFGGLSGHQGALRSAFLVKAGLTKEQFVATGVVVACAVDVARLSVYAQHVSRGRLEENAALLAAACLSAFVGAFAGSRLLRKVTMRTIQNIVGAGLVLIALALLSGLL